MKTDALKSALNNIAPIDEMAWNDFAQYFSERTLAKKDLLWSNTKQCKHLVFINRGLIRSYRNTDKREVTHHFYSENSIFYDDYSFITEKPCIDTYEAIEKTELIVIPRVAVYAMYEKYPCFERIGRLVAERNYINLFEAQYNLKNLTADERYQHFVSTYPTLQNRVQLRHIASYLNLTPEHLSRIRHKE